MITQSWATRYTTSDRTVLEHYDAFVRDFSAGKLAAYLARLPSELGDRYRVATTPVFVTRARYDRLAAITRAVLGLLQQPAYGERNATRSDPTPFPFVPLRKEDYFGAVDFHVSDTEEKIIEVNLFPPGFSSFIERLEDAFVTTFLPGRVCELAGFERRLCSAITAGFSWRDVAIVSNHIEGHHRLPELRFVRDLLEARKVTTALCSAERLTIGPDGELRDGGRPLGRMFNRLIPRDWDASRHELSAFTEAFAARPDRMFTNPNGWYAADKRLLPLLSDLGRGGPTSRAVGVEGAFGLEAPDVRLLSAARLRCRVLREFEDVTELERAFPHRQSVLKPISDYGSRRVLVKPSNVQQRDLFRDAPDGYVVQELFPASEIPYVSADAAQISPVKFDLKIVFLDAAPVGAFARLYSGAMTNFRRPQGGIAPVVVV